MLSVLCGELGRTRWILLAQTEAGRHSRNSSVCELLFFMEC